jgi:DNA polymerase-3 subunit delta
MVITLTGDNSFALKGELRGLIANFKKSHGELSVEQLDAEEASAGTLKEAFTSLSLFSDDTLTIIRSPSKNKEFVEACAELIESTDSEVILVESKFDKRSSLFKTLKQKTDFREFRQLDGPSLSKWLVDQAKKDDGNLSLDNAKYLVERAGADQMLLSQELEKLLIYDNSISRQSIDLLTEETPQSSIFQLLEVAFRSNIAYTLELYKEQLEMKVEPQQIIAMLTWQLHVLATLKSAKEANLDNIAREAKMSPFVLRKSQSLASRIPLTRLKELVSDLTKLDFSLKTRSIDPETALQAYLLGIST